MIISGTTRSAGLRASRRLTLLRSSSVAGNSARSRKSSLALAQRSNRNYSSLIRSSSNNNKRATATLASYQLSSSQYSTEKILTLRNDQFNGGEEEAKRRTLYRSEHEKENCGVGMVASMKSTPSRRVIEDADEMLVRMSHRGGCGCDPASGDGAGKYIYSILQRMFVCE